MMRIVLIIVAILALVGFLAVAVVLPGMAGAEAREAAQSLISGAEPAKQQVSAAAEKANSLENAGQNIKIVSKNDPKAGELRWVVSPNGEIRGWNEKNAIEVSMTPSLQAGKVTWRCRGYPNTSMPASCGGR